MEVVTGYTFPLQSHDMVLWQIIPIDPYYLYPIYLFKVSILFFLSEYY